jgi:signal transduction histidine kinase
MAAPTINRGMVTGLALRVSDTGCGMSPETIDRAFDPFFTTKTGARGSGLGLTMVRRFVQDAGGNVSIESELGLGTAVTLQLPLCPRPLRP